MTGCRVIVGMSGGVDSSVAAYLLKEQGYDVVGLFMRNWNDASVTLEDECPWIDDSRDAMLVAEQLGIPFQVIDMSVVYKERIVDYMFHEYQIGRTPNPDVLCNREIKFDLFLEEALKLGAEFVATGHYVRKGLVINEIGNEEYQLLRGLDENKDQSYFLCQLNQYQLSKALFPIGELEKKEVRQIAERVGLVTAAKKDSQGLCFIGKVSLPDFLQQKLEVKLGDVIEIDAKDHVVENFYHSISREEVIDAHEKIRLAELRLDFDIILGTKVGEHRGAHFYTRGQRKGLQIGGKPLPLFVLNTDVEKNNIYVGQGENHPALFYRGVKVKREDAHWIRKGFDELSFKSKIFTCQIRYRQKAFECELFELENGDVIVFFCSTQKSVTAGQFVTVFEGNELIFSGVISK